jgi:hypothetical protein
VVVPWFTKLTKIIGFESEAVALTTTRPKMSAWTMTWPVEGATKVMARLVPSTGLETFAGRLYWARLDGA